MKVGQSSDTQTDRLIEVADDKPDKHSKLVDRKEKCFKPSKAEQTNVVFGVVCC